jgi:anti-sigma B factor antagonist
MTEANPVVTGPESIGDGLLYRVHGDVDFSRQPELRNALLEGIRQKPARIIVDLAEVDYMDSSGLAALVEALGLQRKKDGKFVLCTLQPKVRNILEIARLDAVFTIAESCEEAATV